MKEGTTDLRTAVYRYCNYQDRCQQEVRNKLYELKATTPEVENLIAELIEVGLLNEERFARSLARGKFRLKHWGKAKIVQSLKQHRISEYCIKKALTEIDYDEYISTLNRLATRKWEELKSDRSLPSRKSKAYRYLAGKGYESGLIAEALAALSKQ